MGCGDTRYWLWSVRNDSRFMDVAQKAEGLLSGVLRPPPSGDYRKRVHQRPLGSGDLVKSDKGNITTQEFIKFTPEKPLHLLLGST